MLVISPERALVSSVALSLYEKRADMGAVALVIRVCPR